MRGFSEANGSWKTSCIRRRSGLQLAPAQLRDVLAVEADAAGRRRPAGGARSGRSCSCPSRTRRPGPAPRPAAPRSETSSTARTVSVPAAEQAAAEREVLAQAPDLDQGRCRNRVMVQAASSDLAPAQAAHERDRRRRPRASGTAGVAAARVGVGDSAGGTSSRTAGAAGSGTRAADRLERHAARRRSSPGAARSAAAPWCRACSGRLSSGTTLAALDDAAGIHHHHPVGDLGDHAQIVGDEDDRHAGARAAGPCSSSRICAWTVTSSAVVGSSAISTAGSQASAMAIITRWRMPPESWCG